MNHEDEIKKILYGYEEAGLIACDPVQVLSFLSDDVMGIGMGEQGFVSSKKEIETIMTSTLKKDPTATYALDYDAIAIQFVSETTANLCAKVLVLRTKNGITTTSGFMQSLHLAWDGLSWHIHQFHASPLMLSVESIEAYPLSFASHTLSTLHKQITTEAFDLMSASFVGGVVGVHQVGDAYPLYFSNEGIARFLGYSVEEFHDRFAQDVSKIFYSGDYDYVMKLTKDVLVHNQDCTALLRLEKKDGSLLSVIDYARRTKDHEGNYMILAVFTDISELVALHEKREEQNESILSSIQYASKIQRNLLPSEELLKETFTDYSTLWSPKDVVSGDIFRLQRFERGTVLSVCDCTGHGTSGALLTMLVASALDNVVREYNCHDTAQLLSLTDQKIFRVLNEHTVSKEDSKHLSHIHNGCDLAILFIAKDGSVTLSSAGIHVFICDGKEVRQRKGQLLHIGEGLLTDKKKVQTSKIPATKGNKFYIASDGLYDQIGGDSSRPFGYHSIKEIICRNHQEPQAVISERIWAAFEAHRGEECRRDDVQLITFQP